MQNFSSHDKSITRLYVIQCIRVGEVRLIWACS